MLRFLVATSLVSLVFFACDGGQKSSQKNLELGQKGNELKVEEFLRQQAERTRDDGVAAQYMDGLTAAVASHYNINGGCGCPQVESSQEGALGLDGSDDESVRDLCSYVNANANRMVGSDGGCWLRANAVCLGALAKGLDVAKIWIDGSVRVGKGQTWNFHVANVYDGKVYDAGWDMNGVSLEEWKGLFSGVNGTSPTEIHIASCASLYTTTGLVDPGFYSESLIGEICTASENFGGLTFAAQMDAWIREASHSGGVVPSASSCRQGYVETLAEQELLEAMRPEFEDDSQLSAACKTKIFDIAAPNLINKGFKFSKFSVKPRSGGRFIVNAVFRRYLVDARAVTFLLSGFDECAVDAVL